MPRAAPSQSSPFSIVPFPQTGGSVVDVVEVVVGTTQPPASHASQQLGSVPTHAAPPDGARHFVASPFTLQRVSPWELVRQQVTAPGRPHAERDAHRTTAARHSRGSVPASTAAAATPATHRLYAPWLVAAAQGHSVSAASRVVATATGSAQAANPTEGTSRPKPTTISRLRMGHL
jgi:hypothetical protein